MMETRHQTVQIRKGRHVSPDRGVCVMELASMLVGERFTDHPRTVCPAIAGFLRSYNDLLPDGQHDELYAYASLVVGTKASASVRRRRACRVLDWGERRRVPRRRYGVLAHVGPWDMVLLPAVEAALRMDPDRRRVAVRALLEELVAMAPRTATLFAPAVAAPGTAPDVPVGG